MSNKIQAYNEPQELPTDKKALKKQKGSRDGLRRQSVIESRSKWDFKSMQSMFSRSKSSAGGENSGNKFSDFISDVNQYIQLQYTSKDPSIDLLDTADPQQDKVCIKIAECLTGENISKQLKNACCSYDGNYLATWNTQNVSLMAIEKVGDARTIPVNFDTLDEPSQVFFMPECKNLAVVEYQEVRIYDIATADVVKTYKLSLDEEGDKQDDIEPLVFKYFVSIPGRLPGIGESHDRHPLILVLCDDYFFYYLSLRKEEGIDSEKSTVIRRYSIPYELKDFRGSEYYIPMGNQHYLTIKYDTTKDVSTTTLKVWKTQIDLTYKASYGQYTWPNQTESGLQIVNETDEENKRITCIDQMNSSSTCTKIWVYDSMHKVHMWMKWNREYKISFEKIMDGWGDLEPTSIESKSNRDYVFVQLGHKFVYILGHSNGNYSIISTHKIQQDSATLVPYNLDKMVIRQATGAFYFPLDFPPTYRAEFMNLPDQQCSMNTCSILNLENGILVSVDSASKTLYHRYHKHAPLQQSTLGGIASQKDIHTISTLRDCKAIKDTTKALFFFANKDTYVGHYFKIQIMVVDFSEEKPRCISFNHETSLLEKPTTFSLSPDGRTVTISHRDGVSLIYADGTKQTVCFKGVQGRSVLIQPPIGDEYLMLWNSADNEVQFSCCFNYFNPKDPSEPPGEECPLNMVVDYKLFKLSEDRSTLVLYGKEGFCVLDTVTKKFQLHSPEGAFELSEHSLEISPDGKLLAVHSTIENRAYLYCTKTLQRQSLGVCHTVSKYITFAFIDYLQKIVIYDVNQGKMNFFSKKELKPVEFPTYFKIGEQVLPREVNLVSMVVNEKSFVAIAAYPVHLQVLIKLRFPLNNVNHLNMYLIRQQISNYFSTDLVDKKASSLNKIIQLISLSPKHSLILHPIFTILVYMLNNYQGFCQYCDLFDSQEVLFFRHNLLDMFFTINMKESMSAVLDVMKKFNSKHQRYPEIDVDSTVLMINTLRRKLLTDQLREEMITLIIFAPYFEKVVGELKVEQYAMAVYTPPPPTREKEQSTLKSDCVKTSLREILKSDPVNLQDMMVYESLIPLDMSTGSDFSKAFFSMVKSISRDNIKTKFKTVIYHKWSKVQRHALAYAFLLWTMNTLLYVFLGYYPERRGLLITVIILNIFFIFFEIKCAASASRSYVKDKWNYVDIGAQTFSIVICLLCYGTPPGELSMTLSFLKVICVLLMGFRSLTWLRVFQSTRYLITMVLEVFIDVVPFLIILVAASLLTSFAWLVLPHLGPVTSTTQEMTFFASMIIPIDMIFGNGPENSVEESAARFWLILISNAVLTLVFLNFLIALISGTFERISADKDLYDVMELLYIIKDFDAFLSGIAPTFRKVFKQKVKKTQVYYISVMPYVAENSIIGEVEKMIESSEERSKKHMNAECSVIANMVYKQNLATREEVKREGSINTIMLQELKQHLAKSETNWKGVNERLTKLETVIKRLADKLENQPKTGTLIVETDPIPPTN